MFLKILLALLACLAVLVVVITLRPADFRISRSATFLAPQAVVFEQVNDLKKWGQWSPWAKLDPQMKQTYEGPPAGTGASSAWVGNNQVGEGRMTITESRSNELVRMKLEFFKPFTAANDVEFTFTPDSDKTVMTWTMTGKNNFVSKAMGLFMNMEKICGDQFEQGLMSIKSIVENPSGS